jgi:hypothetical protein
MKGTPTEVVNLMHATLNKDLIEKIENKVYDIIKTDLIIDSIGSTFINWISYVCNEYRLSKDDIIYERSIWNQHIPDNIQQLANDISFVMKDLSIIHINNQDDEDISILFQHKNNYQIHLIISSPSIREFPFNWDESTLNITTISNNCQ